MQHGIDTHFRGVTPQSLTTIAGITGLGVLVRDEELRVRWCDEAYAALVGLPAESMIGTTLADILPAPAAKEREALLQNVLDTDTPCSLVQFGNDKRLLCRVLPIDEEAFGYRGVLCLLTEGPLIGMNDGTDERSTLVRTPYLDDLAALTKAELRTLYDIACGRANQDIADRQYRSVRTIENHVESIHKKLGTATRSALVRLATERGVQGFTAEEWNEIVDGSAATRKAAPPAKKQALLEAIATTTPPAQDSALN